MQADRVAKLTEFTDFVAAHIRGDEKGEAQVFLDRLFQGFGHAGAREAGATFEERIKKADGKGTSFADLVYKPVALVEMKKRGEDLSKHYRQAFDYWTRLVPGRPRYAVLCNFDELWVYDFDTQMDTPLDKVKVAELPKRYSPLAFLFPTPERPTFGNDQVAVTRVAADHLADCFNKLHRRGIAREPAQRFVLQMLVALFAEDIELLPRYLVAGLLEDCTSKATSYDLLGGLIDAMNTPGRTPGGRFAGVDYFNGGLFADPSKLELRLDEVDALKAAANEDWSKVRPEIFGTLFEHSLDKEERHAFGAHFTSASDIMKIVGPTIVEPWREQIEGARTPQMLRLLRQRMQDYHVLDPACGSGNFLNIAYRQLKYLDARITERIGEMSARDRDAAGQTLMGFISARQFHGLDINPFAVELAKVTMMIARKLAIDEHRTAEPALPLDNLDANFLVGDALIDAEGRPAVWPKADVIIGNPPFLGAKRLKPERGADYVNRVRKAYPDVPGMADYCVYWFRKAHDALPVCTVDDPVAGRAGLVGTQNIRNNQSRVGGLDHIVKDGTIVEAVDNQPWSGEANVHVSIANWMKTQASDLLPSERKLWFKVESASTLKRQRTRKGEMMSKETDLSCQDCAHINSSLSMLENVSEAVELKCNTKPHRCFTGQMVGHDGFLLKTQERLALLKKSPVNAEILYPYLNGREFLVGSGNFDRFVLDFGQLDQLESAGYAAAFDWVRTHVLPDREKKAAEGMDGEGNLRPHHKQFLSRWWQLSFGRPELISQIAHSKRFIACSRVTKRPILVFISPEIRPGDALSCFTFEDDYSFGVLHSGAHWQWFVAKCSKLKSDFRYSPESVFDTFPWPQSPSVAQIDAVAAAGREVRRVRADALTKIKGGLRAVYRTLELPGKNPLKRSARRGGLDASVLAAYGFDPRADLLAQLLALNLAVSAREADGLPVTAPGIPPGHPDPARLVTDDCIRP